MNKNTIITIIITNLLLNNQTYSDIEQVDAARAKGWRIWDDSKDHYNSTELYYILGTRI